MLETTKLMKKRLKEPGLFILKDRRSRSKLTIIFRYTHSGVREHNQFLPDKITAIWGLAAPAAWTCFQMALNSVIGKSHNELLRSHCLPWGVIPPHFIARGTWDKADA